ncbi:hypothetical protein [Priestia megaterium]|jgi:hypothetical protein|uniref:hypothetical protein n=1 Tax=Priestia megaterium TaxID=1404 RepID=UPI00366EB5FA
MKYLVELKHISNDNYEMPSHLEKFEVNSNGMDETIKATAVTLNRHMLDKDDYYIEAGCDYENYAEITFGDANTGSDVCYTIRKY